MASPFDIIPVNTLQALLMQGQGADQAFQQQIRPLQLQEARGKIAARDQLSQMLAGGGTPDYGRMALGMLAAGDPTGAGVLANLTNQQAERGFRDRQLSILEQSANRKEIPAGFERSPTGGMQPIPGGPASPEYLRGVTEAKDKGRDLQFGDITKLSDEGGKAAQVNEFINTFDPNYAGYGSNMLGSASMAAARNLPESWTSQDQRNAANWWQGYDRYKNVVRNELFGASLTSTEQAAFERADITPGMNPSTIKSNLNLQKQILDGAMQRKANALISSGFNSQAVSRAYGIPLDQIGVTQTGKSRPGNPLPTDSVTSSQAQRLTSGLAPTAGAPAAGAQSGPAGILSQAQDAIARGADPRAVAKRLLENNINPDEIGLSWGGD